VATTLRRERATEAPTMPSGQLAVEPPPELVPHEGIGGALMMALPMLASVGAIVFVSAANPGGRGLIAGGMFLVAMLGFVGVQIDRQRKQRSRKVIGARREYLTYLAGVRRTARTAAEQQREALTWLHPEPASLPALAEERSSLWERTSDSADLLQVRYGVAPQPLALELVPPETQAVEQLDPVSVSALHRLLVVHRVQPDLPAAVDLRAFDRVEVTGDDAEVRALARAMVCQAALFHAPDQLAVAVLASDDALAAWDWVKWLPHNASSEDRDAVGPARMIGSSLDELAPLLPADLADRPRFGSEQPPATPHLLLVVDGDGLTPGNHVIPEEGLHGVTVLDLPSRWGELVDESRLRFHLESRPLDRGRVAATAVRVNEAPLKVAADQLDPHTAEAFARRLAPMSEGRGPRRRAGEAQTVAELTDLLGLGDVRDFSVDAAWRPRPVRDRLRVPIGLGEAGEPVHLDIKESAQEGMGPHGLCIGATGSGKSEFLRTLVLALAMTHSSDTLNMVLVDFKGGATFAGMADMPHVSAVITNLADELTLVDRMQDALSGEMVRRQEMLRAAGNYASVRDYEKARAEGQDLEPLPSLLIVVDEFSEMLSEKPEFIDLFVAIGRLGRSLGLHLLLASQRLEEGRLRGLESHLSYRVGLRTFSAAESRTVIGVPDAYELPPTPGLGYLKPDPNTLQRFRASYVSGPPPRRVEVSVTPGQGPTRILPFTSGPVFAPLDAVADPEPRPVAPADGDQASTLNLAVDAMAGHGRPAHRVWLPPLQDPDTLDGLMPDLMVDEELGYVSYAWRRRGALTIPLGTVDRPREQRRDTAVADLGGAAGHVAVVGGPRSGKSTLLRTLVCALALTTTPKETQFYVLDFGGGTFAPLAGLPHVSGVATRSEPDVVRRVVAEVQGIVDRREVFFRHHNIDSIETYRERRRAGGADDGYGDVFLVVDGWSTLRADFDLLEMELQTLAQRGLTFGVHLVTAAARWPDYRAAVRDLFGTRFELRLGDPNDSEIDRKVAALVPSGRPGRGITTGKQHFLAALPRLDGKPDGDSVGSGIDDLIARVTDVWSGQAGPKLRLLPDQIGLERVRELAEPEVDDRRLWLAIDERDLAPVAVDADAEPHLLAFGDSGSGKTTLLRSYVQEVLRTRSADEAQVVLVDYRRSLLGEVPEDYLLHYLTSSAQAQPALQELAAYLENRLPGPDVTPEQLRSRSWWSGAHAFVVVDDYDLVATQQGSPLQPLVPLLAQARDIGLHVVVARRSGGAARALFEPVIQSLRDLAMPGVLLPGSPDEGPLLGSTKPRPGVAGRAQLVTRARGVEVVQAAWSEPSL